MLRYEKLRIYILSFFIFVFYTFTLEAFINFPRIMVKIIVPINMLARFIPFSISLEKYLSYTIVPKTWDPTNPQTMPHCAGENSLVKNLSLR